MSPVLLMSYCACTCESQWNWWNYWSSTTVCQLCQLSGWVEWLKLFSCCGWFCQRLASVTSATLHNHSIKEFQIGLGSILQLGNEWYWAPPCEECWNQPPFVRVFSPPPPVDNWGRLPQYFSCDVNASEQGISHLLTKLYCVSELNFSPSGSSPVVHIF